MLNLLLIILLNLFIFLLFYKLISKKWIPDRNTIIAIIVGLLLVPVAILIEKSLKGIGGISQDRYIIIFAVIEEGLKLLSIFFLIQSNKFRKFTFLELLGIGLGFSFLETIIFGYMKVVSGSMIYPGLATTLYSGLHISFIRIFGALLLHTSTVGLLSLTLVYLKKKRIIPIITALIISIFIHYSFNKKVNETFAYIFIASIAFLLMYNLYIFINSRIEDSDKIKTSVSKITKFILQFIILFSLYLAVFVTFSKYSFGLERYSSQEIEQVKISQDKAIESANSWQTKEVVNRYKESTIELSRINEIYEEIDNNYSRIIKIMEEKKKNLSSEDIEFLHAKESKLKNELERLRDALTPLP